MVLLKGVVIECKLHWSVYLYVRKSRNPLSVDMCVCPNGSRETYDNKGQ